MISIDVGTSDIKIIEMKLSGKRDIKVQKYVSIPHENNFISADFSLDAALFKSTIRDAVVGMHSKEVVITFSCLPNVSNIFTALFEKSPEKLIEIIKAKVYQSISPKDYLMDYRVGDIFMEDKTRKCTIMAFMAPRNLVSGTMDVITGLNKKPISFKTPQINVFDFCGRFFNEDSIIIANISDKKIDAHLINTPDNIITRSANFDTVVSGMDVLSGLIDNLDDKCTKLDDIVSKLQQYQTIKYPGRPLESIYLMGQSSDDQTKEYIANTTGIKALLIHEAGLPINLSSKKDKDLNELVYAIGSGINIGR